MKTNVISILIFALTLISQEAYSASDEFKNVTCGSDIPKAIIGKHSPNERVVVIEGRHKDLGLKDLGADEISDRITTISWLICGNEFLLMEDDHSVVRDVLPFPHHSIDTPEFTGKCQINNKEIHETVIAILGNKMGTDTTVKFAWKIDETNAKFVQLPTEGLRCTNGSIATVDGGL